MRGYLNGEPLTPDHSSGSSSVASTIPPGAIVMWANREIPDGWAICNGENGTPDLRDRFILSSGSAHAPGTTGGEETVTLTEVQIPRHRHSLTNTTATTKVNASGTNVAITPGGTSNTGYAGNGQPHNNMPPYYVLYFIMKL